MKKYCLPFCIIAALSSVQACDPVASSVYLGEPLLALNGHVTSELSERLSHEIKISLLMFGFESLPDDEYETQVLGESGLRTISTEITGTFPAKFTLLAHHLPSDDFGLGMVMDDEWSEALEHLTNVKVPSDATTAHLYSGVLVAHKEGYDLGNCFLYHHKIDFGEVWIPQPKGEMPLHCESQVLEDNLLGAVEEHVLWFIKFDTLEDVVIVDRGPPDARLKAEHIEAVDRYARCKDDALNAIFESRSNGSREYVFSEEEESTLRHACEFPSDEAVYISQFRHSSNINYILQLSDKPVDEWLEALFELIDIF